MEGLPEFEKRPRRRVLGYIQRVLTNPQRSSQTQLRDLIEYEDGHYRAVFDPAYFVLAEGRDHPSRSQWNTLKKRMKRIDKEVFIFKQHGEMTCDGETCFYIDFGFFAD